MLNRKLGKVRILGNLGKIIPSFQNRKFGFKNIGKKFPRFPRFPRFPSFRPGRKKARSREESQATCQKKSPFEGFFS